MEQYSCAQPPPASAGVGNLLKGGVPAYELQVTFLPKNFAFVPSDAMSKVRKSEQFFCSILRVLSQL